MGIKMSKGSGVIAKKAIGTSSTGKPVYKANPVAPTYTKPKGGSGSALNGNAGYVAPEKDVKDISSYVSGAGMGKNKKTVAAAKTYSKGTSGIKMKKKAK
jgi:hypothetical protein